jgi:pimeloyl-ACP methyl ester carboxylesterase
MFGWLRMGVGSLFLAASCVLAQQTESRTTSPATAKETFVLVHGAWAGGWEWKGIGQRLLADGYTVYRPTLTGQGERVHLATDSTDVNTHITDVVNTILFEDLHDVILMGHSYGGVVVTGVVDKIPDRIKAVIYVDAFVPEDGESANAVVGRSRTPTTGPAFLNPAGWPYPPDRKPPYIVPMPAKAFSTPLSLKNADARKVPGVYILTVDRGKTPEQDMFYKSYERARSRGWPIHVMEADHVVHLSKPDELLKLLEAAPGEARSTSLSPKS